MKRLLDECVTHRLRSHITGHDVFSVGYLGWDGVKNGRLLARAAAEGFDAMVTTDRGIEYEQNRQVLPISVYLLEGVSNDISDLLPLVRVLLTTLVNSPPKPEFVRIRP